MYVFGLLFTDAAIDYLRNPSRSGSMDLDVFFGTVHLGPRSALER